MKLTKLTVFVMTFLSISQVALAVGPREKLNEYNGGEFICAKQAAALKDGRAPAVVKAEDERVELANEKSAQ